MKKHREESIVFLPVLFCGMHNRVHSFVDILCIGGRQIHNMMGVGQHLYACIFFFFENIW